MTNVKSANQMSLLDVDSGNFGHGGKRTGAGRHKKRPTSSIRVPTHLIGEIKNLIQKDIENDK